MGSLRTNCFFLYQYKGNSKRFLVGCFAKVPSLNSHEKGILAGCFFKNSKYVYKHPSHLIALKRSKTLGFKENILIYCHQTAIFRGYILKIYPSNYVKGAF